MVIVAIILVAVHIVHCMICFIDTNTSSSIMNDKKDVYKIYNEGLQSIADSYDIITINSPNTNDKIVVFNEGLKNVEFPDLIKLNLKSWSNIIEYSNNKFKSKNVLYYKYICITVDREHIDDISYYEYSEKIQWKIIFRDTIIIILAAFLLLHFACILTKISDNLEKNIKEEKTKKKRNT